MENDAAQTTTENEQSSLRKLLLKLEARAVPVPLTVPNLCLLVVIAFTLAFVGQLGQVVNAQGGFNETLATVMLRTLPMIPVCMLAILIAGWLFTLVSRVSKGKVALWCDKLTPTWSKKSILIFALVMFALWLPYLIAFFPATMIWDTVYQIKQCYPGNHPLLLIPWEDTGSWIPNYFSDHHPIFDTLIYGAFAMASHVLFDTWNYGAFAFALVQAAGTALSFIVGLAYLRRIGAPQVIRFLALLFLCFMPFIPSYAGMMVKDSFFAWFFIPFFIMIIEIVRTKGSALESRKFLIWFIVISILMALTKKTGLYIVMGEAVVFLIVFRAYWKPLLLHAASVVAVMMVILPMIVFPLLDVSPGGKQEALGPFFQQTARYVIEHGDEVTEHERQVIDKVIQYDDLAQRYTPFWQDPVKYRYDNFNTTTSDLIDYFGVWVSQGLKHPGTYLEATFVTTFNYFLIPSGWLGIYGHTGDVENSGSAMLWQPGRLDGLRDAVLNGYTVLRTTPVIDIAFMMAPYVFWLPLMFLYLVARRNKRWLLILVPIAVYTLFLIIGPLVDPRYSMALVNIAPLVMCLMGAIVSRPSDDEVLNGGAELSYSLKE